jgi:uncharacterized protein with beta-barrel porin domain
MTSVRACPGGITAAGLVGRTAGPRLRNAFLGTVAAGALSLALSGPALATLPAGCSISGGGTIETCTGDQHNGVAIAAPTTLTTLNVNNLTTAITPASGTAGISFSSAGAVTINSNTGIFGITTAGKYASGIFAQSTGAGAVTVISTGNIATMGERADGIYALSAGAVTVTSTGNITTAGILASGIFALSTGAVTVTSTGNITTAGILASGISALSTGAVTVTSTGNITTGGQDAHGIFARGTGAGAVTSTGNISTAGGGASGIYAVSFGAGALTVTSTGNITTMGERADGIFARGTGAGAVTVTSTGNITTAGAQAYGIAAFAGTGAVTVTSIGNISTAGINTLGIAARNLGGGAVTVTSTGNITTTGEHSAGIYARSGGGKITTDGAVTVTSGSTLTNSGVTVTFTVADVGTATPPGTITVTAAAVKATAVTATPSSIITAGAVTVSSSGNITAAGKNSYGIYARSSGGPITVNVKSGTVSGGSGNGAGVDLVGGTNNTLNNMGTLTAASGLAIRADGGSNTVNNSGTVIGNVILGRIVALPPGIIFFGLPSTGTNAFNNMAGGLFDSGTTVSLGAGNVLTNAGTLSPGGAGVIQTTALTGNLVQGATGLLLTDINIAGNTSDRINVSGTANLAGAVQVQVLNPILGPWQQTVLSAVGGTTNNGLALLASPALQAQLVYPNSTDVVVKSTGINFVTPGLNNNQTSLANALNGAAQTLGLGGPVFNFLLNGVTSVAGYNVVLNQLTGELATGSQQTTFDAMNLFMGTMLDPSNRGTTSTPGGGASGYASEGDASAYASTKNAGAARDAYAMFTKAPPPVVPFEQRWSVWAAGFGGSQTTDGNAIVGSNNTTSSVYGTAVGADYRISPFTVAGFALAGGGTNFSVANSGSGHSDLFQAGAFVKHTVGAAYVSAALAYGWQEITTNRTVTAAGTNQLRAQFDANAFSGRLEGGYRFVVPWVGGIGITPYAAAQFTTFDLPGYSEQALVGSNAFALAYGAKDVTDTRSELGLRADKSFAMRDGILTLRGRFAWAHDYDPNRSIASTFQSLPGASFVVNGAAQAADSALVTASVEKKWLNGWSAAATFEGEFSDVTRSYAGKGVVRYAW